MEPKLDPINIDLRPADILAAISGLEKYLDVMEAQLEEVHRIERQTLELELEHPADAREAEHEKYLEERNYLDFVYERDLQPAMRYSFIVLTHIILETELRYFCSRVQHDRKLPPIAVTDLRGSAIDQAQTFLAKLAGIRVQGFPGVAATPNTTESPRLYRSRLWIRRPVARREVFARTRRSRIRYIDR